MESEREREKKSSVIPAGQKMERQACKQNPTSARAEEFLEQRQSGRNYLQLSPK